ncbi:MAG: 16S rRNA (guanine(527)-N(7))-methyltransferase RsmG [Thermoanaerobaculia bacterium]
MSEPRLELYKQLLLTWNEKVNLIGPEARDHLDDHIEEALDAARLLKPTGDVLDFGSGGGLPAIPMAIVSSSARFHLVEADQKKWAFLKHVVRECQLNATVYGDRLARVLTRLPSDLRFSLATSRAVGYPEEWVGSLRAVLAPGARVALFQGTSEIPQIDGFLPGQVFPLRRGFLVTLDVPRGTA